MEMKDSYLFKVSEILKFQTLKFVDPFLRSAKKTQIMWHSLPQNRKEFHRSSEPFELVSRIFTTNPRNIRGL